MIFEHGSLTLHVGGKTLRLIHLPGHSPDLVGVLVVNDRILFASDTLMPVPTIFDGNYEDLVRSLKLIGEMSLDCAVQGHGEVILRGELRALIESDLNYLARIKEKVGEIVAAGASISTLNQIGIESCGKSRLPLNGFVSDLHQANLRQLYASMTNGRAPGG